MGKLIKDGVVYAGSPSNATAIRFDNTQSNISATNVQGALDDLDSRIGEGGGISLTWEEYNQLSEEEQANGLYYITDYDMIGEAEMVSYDNMKSGLNATNAQDAIDEIDNKVDVNTNEIATVKESLNNKQPAGNYALKSEIPTDYAKETHEHTQYLTSIPSEYVTESELNAKGYLTQHQSLSGYAKTADHYTKTESDNKYQPKGTYLTSIPSEYVTESELTAKGYLTQHQSLTGYAKTSDIPTKVSELANDKNYLTSYTETDPTVPAWAKAATKPSYTASEVGATTQTYVDTEITKVNEALNELKTFVTPQMFGAKGDGVTDDTAAIQAALDASSYVHIPDGIYMVNAEGKNGGIKPRSNQTIILSENAVIKAITNSSERYHIINIIGANNVTIRGGKVEGEKSTHTGTTGDWGHGISILRSDNITIDGMEIFNCWGDAICMGSDLDSGYEHNCENIRIYNCVLHDCRRQGISITAADGVTVRDCEIYNISGTLPQAGIDIEPNRDDEQCLNIVIDSCYIHDTAGESIVTFHGDASKFNSTHIIDGVRVVNCRLAGIFMCNGGENIFVSNSSIYQVKLASISYAINVSNCRIDNLLVAGGSGNFDNCEFLRDNSSGYLIQSNIEKYPNVVTESLIFNKCHFKTGSAATYFMSLINTPPTAWDVNIPAEKLIKFTSCKFEIMGTAVFSNRMPGELVLENCDMIFETPPYSVFDIKTGFHCKLRLFESKFTWANKADKEYGVTEIFSFKSGGIRTVEVCNCKFSNAARCFYFGDDGNAEGEIRMFNNILNTEKAVGSHKFTIIAVNDLSKIVTSIPSEYVTETELNAKKYVTETVLSAKNYLTLETLPKYNGGVS